MEKVRRSKFPNSQKLIGEATRCEQGLGNFNSEGWKLYVMYGKTNVSRCERIWLEEQKAREVDQLE